MKVKIDGLTHDIDPEAKILSCWNITEELATLTRGVLEHDLSKDQISNILIGLQDLYNIKFNELFADYEKLLKERATKHEEQHT